MPRDPGGIRRDTPSMPAPPNILESADNGGKRGRVLRGGVHGCSGRTAGRPTFSHHFQRGGGCVSTSLGVSDGGGSRRAGRAPSRG